MTYLLSCQNDFLSSSGMMSVALSMRATATISLICHKNKNVLLKRRQTFEGFCVYSEATHDYSLATQIYSKQSAAVNKQ